MKKCKEITLLRGISPIFVIKARLPNLQKAVKPRRREGSSGDKCSESKGLGRCWLVSCPSTMWAVWPLGIKTWVGGGTGCGLQKGSPKPACSDKMLLFIQTEGAPWPYLYLMTH